MKRQDFIENRPILSPTKMSRTKPNPDAPKEMIEYIIGDLKMLIAMASFMGLKKLKEKLEAAYNELSPHSENDPC